MNLADLTRLDIKDLQKIDYKKLLRDLRNRPNVIVSLVAALATIGFILQLFFQTQGDLQNIQHDKILLEEKVRKIEAYTTALNELKEFLAQVPPQINENEFVGLLTDYANAHNVQINSLTPGKGEATPQFDAIRVELFVSVQSYTDLWLFLHDVEHSKYAIRIENWSGAMGPNEKARSGKGTKASGSENNWINTRMTITAINIKKT